MLLACTLLERFEADIRRGYCKPADASFALHEIKSTAADIFGTDILLDRGPWTVDRGPWTVDTVNLLTCVPLERACECSGSRLFVFILTPYLHSDVASGLKTSPKYRAIASRAKRFGVRVLSRIAKSPLFSGVATPLDRLSPVSEQSALTALMQQRESVDLVRVEDAYLWVYRNDHLYSTVRDDDKNLERAKIAMPAWPVPVGPEHTALKHVIKVDRSAALFDIGCNYGREAIRILRTARQAGSKQSLYMFDPGVAGKLAGLNVQLNGLNGFEYFDVALSDIDGHILVHLVSGQSQDNKIINRSESAISIPVRALTLSSFIRAQAIKASACFLKCDTQGAELEVLKGFSKHPLYRKMAGIIEFFPNGLATRIKPAKFLLMLTDEFIVIDVGAHRRYFDVVDENNVEKILSRVKEVSPPYSDLLLISKTLPGAKTLFNQLKKEHEAMAVPIR